MQTYAVIVAGGAGKRMGSVLPKQFLLLKGQTILWHSINSFLNAFNDIHIIVVLPKEHFKEGEEIIKTFGKASKKIGVILGGETRYQSVQQGLKLVANGSIVFVHDAVRCLITKDLIKRCYEQTLELGSAIPAISAIDSIRLAEKNNGSKVLDRNNVKIIQTPQTFLSNHLLEAFEQPFQEHFTDEATVVEAFGNPVFLCEGEKNNIKITTPIDLIVAEKLLEL